MKNFVIVLALLASSLMAQKFTSPYIPARTTVAGLPSASTWDGGEIDVTDGASATDCTAGGGSTRVKCKSNGSVWVVVGSSGSSGKAVYPIYLPIVGNNAGGSQYMSAGWTPHSSGDFPAYNQDGTYPYRVANFGFVDGATSHSANFQFEIPSAWDGGNVTLKLAYFPGSGGSGGQAVRWGLSCDGIGDNEDLNAHTYGAYTYSASTVPSATAGRRTAASITAVIASGAAGETATCSLVRDSNDAADTLTATVNVTSATLELLTNLQ